MKTIPHWNNTTLLNVAESRGGVLATTRPEENLVRSAMVPPSPELLQKFYASTRFQGKTPQDTSAAESGLGYYCDLQSLNSEDAITWSFFGNLAYRPASDRLAVFNGLMELIDSPIVDDPPLLWLWRRIPHPEKPESSGGPEIDFAFLSKTTLVLGEAKWNSMLGQGQGISGDKSQLDLRHMYCDIHARKALPGVRNFVLLGIGRNANVFANASSSQSNIADVKELSWNQVQECIPGSLGSELEKYLTWKLAYSTAR
jgi:hypothetical protein